LMGITLADVADFLRTGYYGAEPERLQRGRDDVRVRVRYPRDERQTIDELESARIRTRDGHDVPLMSVAELDLQQGYSTIFGTNGRRRIAVTASADINRANPSDVIADLKANYLDGLVAKYPDLAWSVQGAEASNQETLGGLQRGFLIAVLGIYVVMAAIFRSYVQPALIVIVIPFGIIGAFWGHMLLGIPVTLISLFGIVALSGVVVNDNIVLIERINNELARGVPFYEALCEGGVRRFRPIFLTTLSTSIGLLPIIAETNLQAQVVTPMAVSIAAGVAFATVLTLLFVPAMMAIFNDGRRLTHLIVRHRWPEPEDVEPATQRRLRLDDSVDVIATTPGPV
jgi:multidrug efflux pump subunit AcrB